ncbi:MAG: hypothetical protein MJ250_09630 [Alphaproteobacteria bacterium]|nr:hypothetical protein [Alphaproteobacteria bacterium]
MKKSLFVLFIVIATLTSCGNRNQVNQDFDLICTLLHQYCPDNQDARWYFANESGDTIKIVFIKEFSNVCKPNQGWKCLPFVHYNFQYDLVSSKKLVGKLMLDIEYLYSQEELNISSNFALDSYAETDMKSADFGYSNRPGIPLTDLESSLSDALTLSQGDNSITFAKHNGPVEFCINSETWHLVE